MTGAYILSDYLDRALAQAEYDKLEDGTFFGKIPSCKGVVAIAATLRECENELYSTLEDWVLVGLKLGHELPVIATLNLNMKPTSDSVPQLKMMLSEAGEIIGREISIDEWNNLR